MEELREGNESAIIQSDWPAPDNIVAFTTTRNLEGACSKPPYNSWNLGGHVDDDPAAVEANQALLAEFLPPVAAPCWLQQVHGTQVVKANESRRFAEADAAWSSNENSACAVLTADCLPVLFCSEDGDLIAAAHAGWRGLVAGVLERTVDAMGCPAKKLMAWMGPAIGPDAFEVGPEVRDQFLYTASTEAVQLTDRCFTPNGQHPGHYYADLYALARLRLQNCGLDRIYGGGFCTYSDPRRFYSYRRDGQTGRMASVIAFK
jgi:purine-nucleoside/S-methyl-5'-thioadenosine phosphorylase / adenosine deaminase